jgi:hypothetical protein
LGAEQYPSKALFTSKSIQEQTVPAAQVEAYGSHFGRQTGPLAPPSSMQSSPALQESSGLQICPAPPVSVQVCAVVLQPMPFLQSPSARHWTQVPPMQTGVAGLVHCGSPLQPVAGTQVLLLVHTMFAPQSVVLTHWTHAGNGLVRQIGVAAGQSCACVAVVQTALHESLAHL